MMRLSVCAIVAVIVACGFQTTHAAEDAAVAKSAEAESAAPQVKAEAESSVAGEQEPGQTLCPVMGLPIDKNIYTDHEGCRVYFCCPMCVEKFKKNPETYLKKLDEEAKAAEAAKGGPSTQKVCPVMGMPIDKDVHTDHEGRRVYFCCPMCVEKFKKDPETYLKKLDEEAKAAETAKDEPPAQKLCPVMGSAINKDIFVDHGDRRVYFCCPMCVEKFKKNPETYLKKFDEEAKAAEAAKGGPSTQKVCPVMGMPIDKDVHTDHEGRRVYFCCPMCVGKFKKDPETYLKKLDAAGEEAGQGESAK